MQVKMRSHYIESDDQVMDDIVEAMYRVEKTVADKYQLLRIILFCAGFFAFLYFLAYAFIPLMILALVWCWLFAARLSYPTDSTKEYMREFYYGRRKADKEQYVYYEFKEETMNAYGFPEFEYKSVSCYEITDKYVVMKVKKGYVLFGWCAVDPDKVDDVKKLLIEKLPIQNSI